MADIESQRITPEQFDWRVRRHLGIPVAAGQIIWHGTIVGLNSADTTAHRPGSGVYPLGRASCKNGVSASGDLGETVDIEEGSFSWDLKSGDTLTAIGQLVYASSNHEVSVAAASGQAFATYEGMFDGLPFFLCGYGARVDLT